MFNCFIRTMFYKYQRLNILNTLKKENSCDEIVTMAKKRCCIAILEATCLLSPLIKGFLVLFEISNILGRKQRVIFYK